MSTSELRGAVRADLGGDVTEWPADVVVRIRLALDASERFVAPGALLRDVGLRWVDFYEARR